MRNLAIRQQVNLCRKSELINIEMAHPAGVGIVYNVIVF